MTFRCLPLDASNRCHLVKWLKNMPAQPTGAQVTKAKNAERRLLDDKMTPDAVYPVAPTLAMHPAVNGALDLYPTVFHGGQDIFLQVFTKCPQIIHSLPAWPGCHTVYGPKSWSDPEAWNVSNHGNACRIVLAAQCRVWPGNLATYPIAKAPSAGRLMALASALSLCPTGAVFWPTWPTNKGQVTPSPVEFLTLYNAKP